MAKPRIFISSTFYDLRQIRADLEKFIKEVGYEPVLNERGHIPYGRDEKLEEYCYREISNVDILISIVGGRFGSPSFEPQSSISNIELKTARDLSKQVYIFIEKSVDTEYYTYLRNKDSDSVTFNYVDDIRIYKFLEEIRNLSTNNILHQFETAEDIIGFLKEQWAGLYQRLLQESSRQREYKLIDKLSNTSKTLDELVEYLSRERRSTDAVVEEILLRNHPAFSQLKNELNLKFPIIFTTKDELNSFMHFNGYRRHRTLAEENSIKYHYRNELTGEASTFLFSNDMFDIDQKLKIVPGAKWNSNWIKHDYVPALVNDDDDIPF
ncbi:DUF4062 domain-containing protein [Leptospira stimsonii]|uniref:DUF4062 domain-containing protein n=1 Tax=Leptospira stimsonii TaxID=2202203 RepID=A0A396YRZ0_9LEPT|nr:DUF4062 domain-containing protein [Leptospira stimsonii]RHX83620.1 hypothetical protein DLM75_23890 [Leptospira stimsonii]